MPNVHQHDVMSFLALLIILLFGAGLFWLIAYLLRRRMQRVAIVIASIGTLIALFLLALWLVEISGWQREGLYKQLSYGLEQEDIIDFIEYQDDIQETSMLMMSMSGTALTQMAALNSEHQDFAEEQLTWMVGYLTNEARFPVWREKRGWSQQLFFLTHAAIVMAHYQSATADTLHDDRWKQVVTFLHSGIRRSQYKHLASRPHDSALRPADNAAALYALKLYDDYHGTDYALRAGEDWSNYIRKELQYEDTKLPCAGFTVTNRCRLSPVGGSLAMLNAYSEAADLPISRDFWREFRYYYKESFVNVFGWVNVMARGEDLPDFCEASMKPLLCEHYQYETSLAQYAAAQRKDWITYYQLNNSMLMTDFFRPPNRLWQKPPQEKVRGMVNLAIRLAAVTKP